MPTLHPAEVWQATGRYDAIGQEMFRLQDRGGRDMVLAMTHEEVFALAGRQGAALLSRPSPDLVPAAAQVP